MVGTRAIPSVILATGIPGTLLLAPTTQRRSICRHVDSPDGVVEQRELMVHAWMWVQFVYPCPGHTCMIIGSLSWPCSKCIPSGRAVRRNGHRRKKGSRMKAIITKPIPPRDVRTRAVRLLVIVPLILVMMAILYAFRSHFGPDETSSPG